MRAHRLRSHHVESQLRTKFTRLCIKIEKNFHVVGNEANGRDHDVGSIFLLLEFTQRVKNVRLEPRLRGRSAPALVHQPPFFVSQLFGYQPARFPELLFVVATLRHRQGDAVCRTDQLCPLTSTFRNFHQRMPDAIHDGLNKSRMVVEGADLVHDRRAVAHRRLRASYVLPILRQLE